MCKSGYVQPTAKKTNGYVSIWSAIVNGRIITNQTLRLVNVNRIQSLGPIRRQLQTIV